MLRLFRRHRKAYSGQRDRYRSIFQSQLRYKYQAGEIDTEEYRAFAEYSDSDRVIDRLIEKHAQSDPVGFEMDDIFTWFKENWEFVLRIVLTIALVFLMEEDDERDV